MTGKLPPGRRLPGVVALPVALAMALAMLLLVGIVSGNLLTTQGLSANHYRSAVASAAADAGLDAMLGLLNAGDPVDAQCHSRHRAPGPTFREQQAVRTPGAPAWAPPDQPVHCAADGATWACQCGRPTATTVPHGPPSAASPASQAPGGPARAGAAFSVRLLPADPPDLMQIQSQGCSGNTPQCAPAAGHVDAQARAAALVAWLPSLPELPQAGLTVHGDIDLGTSTWTVQAASGAGGPAVQAGGAVLAGQWVTGSSPVPAGATAVRGGVEALRITPDEAFAARFHMDAPAWRDLPTVTRVPCASACDGPLREAMGPLARHRMLWLDGGLRLDGPLQLGTPEAPVLLVADGPVALGGHVVLHGLLFARAPAWRASGALQVHGGVVVAGHLHGAGPVRIDHDPPLLASLRDHTGTFVRVPGSWKDFE